MLIYSIITTQQINGRRKTSLEKYIPLTLFVRVQKGYSKFAWERELETEHNWNILTPNLWPLTLYLSRSQILNRRSRGHSAGWWLSLRHLISIFSGTQLIRTLRPLRPDVAFPTTSRLQLAATQLQLNWLLFNSSALYYLQTPTRRYGHASRPPQFLPISGDRDVSLPLSLEWPTWSSSSRNNCHAVHRSLSSGASVYECTMGIFFSSSHFISQFPPTRFPLTTAIRMCHLLSVHHLGMAFLTGSKGQNTTLPYPKDRLVQPKHILRSSLVRGRPLLVS